MYNEINAFIILF